MSPANPAAGPRVTVVIATYNSAALLRHTLGTLLRQTVLDWTALVVGDCCTDDTAEVVASFGDDRLRFINLPERFGEQAGPNSVGLALAETPLVAFLNQDDLWFPDHLALALEALERQGAGFHMARAAFYRARGKGMATPLFFGAHDPRQTLEDAFHRPPRCIEPISAWVGKTALFRRVGGMRLAGTLAVPPVLDFARRLALACGPVPIGQRITVLKTGRNATQYGDPQPHVARLAGLLERGALAGIEEAIADDLWLASQLDAVPEGLWPSPSRSVPGDRLVLARDCGIDLDQLDTLSRGRGGWVLTNMLKHRTGETISDQPDVDAAIEFARARLH